MAKKIAAKKTPKKAAPKKAAAKVPKKAVAKKTPKGKITTPRMMGVPEDGSKPFVMAVLDMGGGQVMERADNIWRETSQHYVQKLSTYYVEFPDGKIKKPKKAPKAAAAKAVSGKPTSPDDVANLVKLLNEARAAYVAGKPIMDDASFDALEDRLRKWDKKNAYFKQVGAPIAASERKVKLPFKMGSLGKVKTGKDGKGALAKWLAAAKWPVYVTPKYDGMAALICVDDSGNTKLYTRGNGTVGQDVSHLLPALRAAKRIGKLAKGFRALKGELILTAGDFAKIKAGDPELKNARNTMAGMLTSKATPAHAGSIQLVIHGQIAPRPTKGQADVLRGLAASGWTVAPVTTMETATSTKTLLGKAGAENAFTKKLDATRKKHSHFDLDGLVLTDSGYNQIAFKGPDNTAATEISHITWDASKGGLLKPVAHFKTPMELDGVTVKQASVDNAATVKEKGLGKGAMVIVKRSNQVIPRIETVVKPAAKPDLPPGLGKTWEWKGREAKLIRGASAKHDTKSDAKMIAHGLKVLGVEGYDASRLETLVGNGYDSLAKVLHATVPELRTAGGLGPTQAKDLQAKLAKRWEALKAQAGSQDAQALLMTASAAWPHGWGRRVFKTLLKAVPFEKLAGADLGKVKGFGEVRAGEFAEGFERFKQFMAETGLKFPKASATAKGKLTGMTIVMTNVRDAELEEFITAHGGENGNSVTKDTSLLVSGGGDSGKTQKAQRYGVRIVSLDQAWKELRKKAGVKL